MEKRSRKEKIKRKKRITQRQVAKYLGCSEPFLSAYKNGKKELGKNTALKWAKLLRVKPEKLMFSSEIDRPKLLGLPK